MRSSIEIGIESGIGIGIENKIRDKIYLDQDKSRRNPLRSKQIETRFEIKSRTLSESEVRRIGIKNRTGISMLNGIAINIMIAWSVDIQDGGIHSMSTRADLQTNASYEYSIDANYVKVTCT
ncbi:hypothetical protein EVAR_65736_1 [Eumeta japonica]|uniref:Uncharacterized protein n=1 Tax=Eumeta variegata TaxID=151549 RepID=A0A4C1ZRC4_EUMVA|nr:hypothetical protein EVAR_65736_1 [Eumeta japonica]